MNISYRFVRSFAVTVIIIASIIAGFPAIPVLAPAAVQGSSSISVWWPTDGASVSGVQPFKALVDGMPADSYSMSWQVDNGQSNDMPTNNADAPHKEASVDVSTWNWSSSGSYQIGFTAKDKQGNTIGQRQVTIRVNNESVHDPAPAPHAQSPVVSSDPPAAALSESIWWPTDGASVSGVQPFKARIDNLDDSDYTMFWQVDNGQLNQMSDNSTDGAHKEAPVDVSGWSWRGIGPYSVNFVAKNDLGAIISQRSVSIFTGVQAQTPPVASASAPAQIQATNQPQTVPDQQPQIAPESPAPVPTNKTPAYVAGALPFVSGDPLSGLSLYVDPDSNAADQVRAWASSDPADAALVAKIASEPAAKWLGDWNTDIYSDTKNYVGAAAAAGETPVLVAYDIPDRDCGGYSSGGAANASAYAVWISSLAAGIGSNKAVVILEPDSLASADCLSDAEARLRYEMISNAVTLLKSNNNTLVYLDAGNSNWIGATDMAARLNQAGIAKADGFSLNVSNYYWTADNMTYGKAVSNLVGGKHFVIDTSRNGLGPLGSEWCNPDGRALGARDTTETGDSLVDAFLWLKNPGESDGACNGGPSAGVWWPEQALGLSARAAY